MKVVNVRIFENAYKYTVNGEPRSIKAKDPYDSVVVVGITGEHNSDFYHDFKTSNDLYLEFNANGTHWKSAWRHKLLNTNVGWTFFTFDAMENGSNWEIVWDGGKLEIKVPFNKD